ncbi:Deoxyribodipyrimidine photo-lyase [Acaryochloris thomasi RCC1774]|uniref:Deoxyribodipyrimidine photo-lyase n=1 Tax=Acaryochloris thomasi RCC1774 TaxID=1764569 RepID=A0A2W1JEY8_9CYAN|nr:FAD-binding domain-containing protein [Acaryochloris thomasi]PZD72279.1 Deoxyribodipyrimidine photo-lyase [Acaryochloris thomasi RCC1774]
MADLILFWHRRDLRIADNVGLAAAREYSAKLVGVFCLDPNILDGDDVAPARVTYMIGCLQSLQQRYQKAGSQLLILHQDPAEGLPRLAKALDAKAVFWNRDVEPYGVSRDRNLQATLIDQGIKVETFWDQLLHTPEEIFTGSGGPYKVYGPFWRNWIQHDKATPAALVENLRGLTDTEIAATEAIKLPTASELGLAWDRPLFVEPGEDAAQNLLDQFCHSTIEGYDQQRNFPATVGTSSLSAPLKFGVIGIRTVWAATETALEHCRSEEGRKGIQTWRQELAWREFYQHALFHFPELAEQAYRPLWQTFPWHNDEEHFQAWCEGKTGYPIVDAAMRQLNETGWMHNRCRMIVASFLVKDLVINWQWGEKYFMQTLIDGDLAANNGGWQWSASSGMDPKPLRIFNPASQAQKFDPEAEYIRQWVPEVRTVETKQLVTGKVSAAELERCGYPAPIVEHKQQQRLFKEIYREQKEQLPQS